MGMCSQHGVQRLTQDEHGSARMWDLVHTCARVWCTPFAVFQAGALVGRVDVGGLTEDRAQGGAS